MAVAVAPNPVKTRTTWKIDPAHTSVEFSAKHLMITTVRGSIADVEGTIQIDETHPTSSSVEAVLKGASLDTRSGQRDDHLRSADFHHAVRCVYRGSPLSG